MTFSLNDERTTPPKDGAPPHVHDASCRELELTLKGHKEVLASRFTGRLTFADALRIAGEMGLKMRTQNAPALDPERDPLSRETGGHLAFTFLPGSVKGGRAIVLAFIDNAYAPYHEHGDGGEEIETLCGTLRDTTDDGEPIFHRRGDPTLHHNGRTKHKPSSRGCWIGVYEQPTGARNLTDDEVREIERSSTVTGDR